MTGMTHSKQKVSQGYSFTLEMRFLLAIVLFCSFIILGTITMPIAKAATATSFIPTSSYNCSTVHCYGRDLWAGSVTGGATTITVNRMSSGDNFVDNEMWVAQPSSSGDCGSVGSNYCWVEAGYASGGSNNGGRRIFLLG